MIKLIVGLGNPGAKYQATRHNAGFWFIDRISDSWPVELRAEARFSGHTGRVDIAGNDVRLLKPDTFMNNSGRAVAAVAGFYRIPVESVLVVHDEVDLPVGTVRLKSAGGHGGHNGLRDIIQHAGGKNFQRLRLGVGHPGSKDQVVNYVLGKPSADDRQLIDAAIDSALQQLPDILNGDTQAVMNKLHSKGTS